MLPMPVGNVEMSGFKRQRGQGDPRHHEHDLPVDRGEAGAEVILGRPRRMKRDPSTAIAGPRSVTSRAMGVEKNAARDLVHRG